MKQPRTKDVSKDMKVNFILGPIAKSGRLKKTLYQLANRIVREKLDQNGGKIGSNSNEKTTG